MQESMSYRTGAYFFVFMLGVIAGMGILGGILDAEGERERERGWDVEEAYRANCIAKLEQQRQWIDYLLAERETHDPF